MWLFIRYYNKQYCVPREDGLMINSRNMVNSKDMIHHCVTRLITNCINRIIVYA